VRLLRAVDDIPKVLENNLFFHLTDSTSVKNDQLQAKKGAVSIESISLDRVFFQRKGLKNSLLRTCPMPAAY
jgi:hypothetical protein